MIEKELPAITDKIFQAIFGRDNPYDLETLRQKFAFDIQLPTKVKDSWTGQTTYSAMPNAHKYITVPNTDLWNDGKGWLREKPSISGIKDLLKIWREELNYTSTERVYDSEDVAKSDPICNSRHIYCSTNCGGSSYLIFCDGSYDSNYAIACQRSSNVNYCLRADDSNACTNCYSVICSGKISNSLFIQDASNLHECMFCSHISNQEYCILNSQYEKEEYFFLKNKIIEWIFKPTSESGDNAG